MHRVGAACRADGCCWCSCSRVGSACKPPTSPPRHLALTHAHIGRLAPLRQAIPPKVVEATPPRAALDEYARRQWEQLLLYLVGSRSAPPAPAEGLETAPLQLQELFAAAGLLLKDEVTRKYSELVGAAAMAQGERRAAGGAKSAPPRCRLADVSDFGFRFLLMGTYGQLWVVLKQYITGAEGGSDGELASVISFLLRLGSQAQTCIAIDALTGLERRVAAHIAQLGLAKPFSAGGATWLAPTPLAATMAGGQAGTTRAAADGFIVVESNYRCARCRSTLRRLPCSRRSGLLTLPRIPPPPNAPH